MKPVTRYEVVNETGKPLMPGMYIRSFVESIVYDAKEDRLVMHIKVLGILRKPRMMKEDLNHEG